jgi:hypothetical protein
VGVILYHLKERVMEIAKWIEISEVAVGVLGLAYGYYEYRQRDKLSKVVKVHPVADMGVNVPSNDLS